MGVICLSLIIIFDPLANAPTLLPGVSSFVPAEFAYHVPINLPITYLSICLSRTYQFAYQHHGLALD